MLPDLHTGFSRGSSCGLVFPSLSEYSTIWLVVREDKIFMVEKFTDAIIGTDYVLSAWSDLNFILSNKVWQVIVKLIIKNLKIQSWASIGNGKVAITQVRCIVIMMLRINMIYCVVCYWGEDAEGLKRKIAPRFPTLMIWWMS